jgi:hypothetical protein
MTDKEIGMTDKEMMPPYHSAFALGVIINNYLYTLK